jgi:hypothetical protein
MLKRDVFSKDEFKKMGKYFVFVTIDADTQKGVFQQWNVHAMPTIKFTTADSQILNEFLGYKPLPAFLQEMEKARSAGGK